MKRKMARIAWIADYSTTHHLGGAQQTNAIMITNAPEFGFDVELVTYHDYKQPKADLFILNNLRWFWEKHRDEVKWMIESVPYIRYEHDYAWLYMERVWVEKLFANSLLNVFLSPLHQKAHIEMLGEKDYLVNAHCQPSPVDTSVFNREGRDEERAKNWVLYCGGIAKHKGIENVIEYAKDHPELWFSLAGWKEQTGEQYIKDLPYNCHLLGIIPYEQMPDYYRAHEYLVHKPNWNEPFGRLIFEAVFCGCKLIVNKERIGCLSYDWNYDDLNGINGIKERLKEAPKVFWEKISEVI